MNDTFLILGALPTAYWLAAGTLVALSTEALFRRTQPWAIPAAMVYLTITGWYMLEPIELPEMLSLFSDDALNTTYLLVWIFLVSYRALCSSITAMLAPRSVRELNYESIPAGRILAIIAIVWLILLIVGVNRLGEGIIMALFPVDSRTGSTMWQRAAGADAGTWGFAVAIANYLYNLCLALFGALLPLVRSMRSRVLGLILVLVSWPYAFMQGNRSVTLLVFVPLVVSFLIFSKTKIWVKASATIVAGVFINYAMILVINYRNVGFSYNGDKELEGHLGLNMASELTYCADFLRTGVMEMAMGKGFLAELGQFVPRFLMPNKPLIGIDYAVARGFGGAQNDIGVFATISTGVIGQGVLEFGPYVGPIVMASLMAIWTGLLARFRAQGTLPRACLFLLGMGLTFNLGRNVTMLVMWPLLFAYVLVLIIERLNRAEPSQFARLPGLSEAR